MERFDVSPIKINHLAFKLSNSGARLLITETNSNPFDLPDKKNGLKLALQAKST